MAKVIKQALGARKLAALFAFAACVAGFARDLVWNGGAGGTWDDTSETWLDGSTPCAWEDGAIAVFNGSVVVAEGASLDVAFDADGTGAGTLAVAGTLALPDDLTVNLSGADNPMTRHNLLTAAGGITGDTSSWEVRDSSGNAVAKAKVKLAGNSLTLVLDAGTLLIFR